MINSVNIFESNVKKPYLQSEGSVEVNPYWILPDGYGKDEYNKDVGVKSVFTTPNKARKTNNFKTLGLSIAGAMVLTAGVIFFLFKGGPKGFSKAFKNAKDYFETKIVESKLRADTAQNKGTLYMSRIFSHAFERAEAVNNYTTIKDLAFKKFMGISKFTEGIHNRITQLFIKIGRKSVKNTYDMTGLKLASALDSTKNIIAKNLGADTTRIEINGVSHTKLEWLNRLVKLSSDFEKTHNAGFGAEAINTRYEYMSQKIMPTLYNQLSKMRTLFTRENITKFAAESAITKQKNNLQKEVLLNRKNLSYNTANFYKNSDGVILDIAKLLNSKDINDISELGSLRMLIKQYAKGGAKDDALRQKIIRALEDFEQKPELNSSIKENILSKTAELKGLVNGYQQGSLEEILMISKSLFTPKEYKTIEKSYNKYIKSLDKSIKIETEDFISKLRDLTMGSAPTDVLTMVGSLFVLGYELAKSKDFEQRQSIALKYGFPALAGIGVSLYCNAKLFAGTKSLLFGLGSTFILNRMGEVFDDMLKTKKSQKKNNKNFL